MIAQNYYQDVDIIDENNEMLNESSTNETNNNNDNSNSRMNKQRTMSAQYGYNRGNSETDDNNNNNILSNLDEESNNTKPTNTSNLQRATLSSRAGFRPMSSRLARVATASLLNVNENNNNRSLCGMDVTKLDLHKIGQCKPMLAKLLCEYLFYVEHKPKLACELCQAALQLDLLDSRFNNSNSNNNNNQA